MANRFFTFFLGIKSTNPRVFVDDTCIVDIKSTKEIINLEYFNLSEEPLDHFFETCALNEIIDTVLIEERFKPKFAINLLKITGLNYLFHLIN
jgi:hypothetical protein